MKMGLKALLPASAFGICLAIAGCNAEEAPPAGNTPPATPPGASARADAPKPETPPAIAPADAPKVEEPKADAPKEEAPKAP